MYWNLLSHLGLPSSLGISGSTDKSFDILMKYPCLLSPSPCKWEDASKPLSYRFYVGWLEEPGKRGGAFLLCDAKERVIAKATV